MFRTSITSDWSSSPPVTSRKVTAQRKFAQGAFVPPLAVPSTSNAATTAAERKETLPTTTNDKSSEFHNKMTAKSLLDMICFRGSHTHLQPIVLVERLRGPRMEVDKDQDPSTTELNGTGTQLNVEPVQDLLVPIRSTKRKVIKPHERNPTNTHTMTLRKRKEGIRTYMSLLRQQTLKPSLLITKPNLKRYRTMSHDSSIDDNRPLKYFARVIRPETPRTPRARVLSRAPVTTRAPVAPQADATPQAHATPQVDVTPQASVVMGPPALVPRNVPPSGSESSEYVKFRGFNSSIPSEVLHLQPSTSGASEKEDKVMPGSSRSYYSEQSIHQWIDGSISIESSLASNACSPVPHHSDLLPLPTPAEEVEDEVQNLDSEQIFVCPAAAWKVVKDIFNCPRTEFASRCCMCAICEKIDKVKKLSTLLKKQKKIDCFVDETDMQASFRNKSTSRPKILTSELIPQHPHLMIKMTEKISESGNKFIACLIPRSDAVGSEEFLLVDHEYILDNVIENLSLNFEDTSSNFALPSCTKQYAETPYEKSQQVDNPKTSSSEQGTIEDEEGSICMAPIFYPNSEEFMDPIAYFKKISGEVAKSGICKIVPPEGFVPTCKTDDDMRFVATNQYISRLYNRWGPAAREMCAIKACLKAQNISFYRLPSLDGVELNLPQFYHLVQKYGGLENVINNKKWDKVVEAMKLSKNPTIERKLDAIYFKYLLPYDTLSAEERQEFLMKAEKAWNKKHRKLLDRANNPLRRKRQLLAETDSSSDDAEEDYARDAEDCVQTGPIMNLAKFKKIARSAFDIFFKDEAVDNTQIEAEYWRRVTMGSEHVCVNSASIDTGSEGYGFTKKKNDEYEDHPWNLKVFSRNKSNVLKALGPVLGVTVPTLHLGMIFSTSCWHRDPHSLPWIEYFHNGAAKIWYGVPEKQEFKFRRGIETLIPTACQNKSLWLSSDIAMIPPNLLRDHGVKVCKVEQNPGEFVLVMPRAYSCSISTGYTVSESTYFATESWIESLSSVVAEIRESCEPTMFAIDRLLKCLVEDPRTKRQLLKQIQPTIEDIFKKEIEYRNALIDKGIVATFVPYETSNVEPRGKGKRLDPTCGNVWNVRDQDECAVCRRSLFLSKIKNIPFKNATVCLEHALEILSKPKYCRATNDDLAMYIAFTNEELRLTINHLEQRLANYK